MYTLGIDIGSTTSKCAVLKDGEELVATSLRVGGMGTEGPQEALDDLWADSGLRREEMARTIVTGYGRKNYEGADGEVSELTCHAMGGRFVFPGLRTVIDIGGQDAKIISLTEDGRMANFVMNDKCAAGTGRFLDVMASILRMDVSELAPCAAQSPRPSPRPARCSLRARSSASWPPASSGRISWPASARAWRRAWRRWPGGPVCARWCACPAAWRKTALCAAGWRSA